MIRTTIVLLALAVPHVPVWLKFTAPGVRIMEVPSIAVFTPTNSAG
jgi:hypothetical protein